MNTHESIFDKYKIRDEELKLKLQKFLIKLHDMEKIDSVEAEEIVLHFAKSIGLLENQIEKLEVMAYRDPLTKILNRRGMKKLIEDKSDDSFYSVIIVDTEDLKEINDTYGHRKGDVVLKIIAETIGQMVGEDEIYGRLGGDEFLIALHGYELERAKKKCDAIGRVVSIISQNKVDIDVSVSFGIAKCESKDLIFDVLPFADRALYESKGHGKNQTSIYNDEGKTM